MRVVRARVTRTHVKKRRRQSLADRRVRARVDFSVSLRARAHTCVYVCILLSARGEGAHT